VIFRDETSINGDLRNESQKTSTFALTSEGGNASKLILRTEIIRLVQK
jgi:hypothetical protein